MLISNASRVVPALLIRMLTLPNSFSTTFTNSVASSKLLTSALKTGAFAAGVTDGGGRRVGADLIAAVVQGNARPPCSQFLGIAAPIPLLLPVTSAILPVNPWNLSVRLLCCRYSTTGWREKRKGKYSTFGNVCIGLIRSNRQATECVPVYVVLDTAERLPFSTELPREPPYLGRV